MPTSAREEVTNSPEISVKTVRSAGSMWASTPTNYIRFDTAFQGKQQKNCLPAIGRETGKMYAYAFSLCEAVKRFRMAANWQRVAVPVGRSLPSVPLMRPWPTAHCMAGTA